MWHEISMIQTLIPLLLLHLVFARDPPMVTIPDQGTLMGTYLKMVRIQSVIAYMGIPYAHPPIGDRRFTPPVVDDIPSWEGVRNASVPPPDCWQSTLRRTKHRHDEIFSDLVPKAFTDDDEETTHVYDEDCLYLNVFIPDGKPIVTQHTPVVPFLFTQSPFCLYSV